MIVYTDYVLGRLAILYQSISTIKERLESELSSEEQLSLSSILDCLGDLLTLFVICHQDIKYQYRSLHTVVVRA